MELYRKAWAAYAAQQFDEAGRWARQAARADPENGHAFSLLGEIAYLAHDLETAKEAWQKAQGLNPQLTAPLAEQIAQVEMELKLEAGSWRQEAGSWKREAGSGKLEAGGGRREAGGLVIRVPKDLPAEQEQAIFVTLSEAVEELEPYFQYRVNRPLTVLIYPRELFYGKNEIASAPAGPRNDGGSLHMPTQVLGLFDGKIRMPASQGARINPGTLTAEGGARQSGFKNEIASGPAAPRNDKWGQVLWHEYAHAVVYDVSHGRSPRWLQEGLAQEAERIGSGKQETGSERREAGSEKDPASSFQHPASDGLPSLRALLGIAERPGEPVLMPAGQFYAASRSLVRYLLELKGWDRMRLLLGTLGQGISMEEAIQGHYGLDFSTLEKRWRGWYHSG